MGRFDVTCKSFFSKPQNFADMINGVIFGGRMVINPMDLEEAGTERIFDEDSKSYFVDIAKKWTVNGYNLLIIAIENQKAVDYSMVIRNMVSEALSYKNQVNDIRSHHKNMGDLKGDEYLSGFANKDMLTPVITVVIYFGEKAWDGPRSLYDMLDMDKRLEPYIYNYKLNLMDYHDYENYDAFQDECRIVFEALAARDNEEKTDEFISKHKSIHIHTGRLVGEILNINYKKEHIVRTLEGDEINMCKAWDDHYNSGKNAGKAEGIRVGKAEGKAEGINLERENNASNMIKHRLSVDTIMACINISLDELQMLSEKIGVGLTY